MYIKFLVDAQLPPSLASELRDLGYTESRAVREIGLHCAKDSEIYHFACTNDMVVVTKDADFAQYVKNSENKMSVVWLRVGNTSNAALRAWFLPKISQIIQLLKQGCRLIEIR